MVIRPETDTRSGSGLVEARCGLSREAEIILGPDSDVEIPQVESTNCILVDEAQFLSPNQVSQLRQLTKHAPVITYGLRTDSRTQLFPGSKRLLELADSIEEIKTICSECPRKSIVNARFRLRPDGTREILYDGDQIAVGGEEMYYALCFGCWDKKRA